MSRQRPAGDSRALPPDYDDDPDRFAVNQAATASYNRRGDVHAPIARRLRALGVRDIVDLGGGTGTLATELAAVGLAAVVVDKAAHLEQAPRPAVRADLRSLPFRAATFDVAACLWVLYHLDDPRTALREAARVLRPGGWFVAATSARTNDPELADVLPDWGRAGTFDAEDAADVVGSVLTEVVAEHWDEPMVDLPDRHAVARFLRGRGLSEHDATDRSRSFITPMAVTKRGCLVWARSPA